MEVWSQDRDNRPPRPCSQGGRCHIIPSMENHHLSWYFGEVSRQAGFAQASAITLNGALASDGSDAVLLCFSGAQGILTAAAQISKLLWADTGRDWSAERIAFAHDRARALRDVIRPDTLLQQRAVRNAVEHFDERLDHLFYTDPKANVMDWNVMPKSMISIDNGNWLRNLDPTTMTYSALDKDVDLNALYRAVESAGSAADAWSGEYRNRERTKKDPHTQP